MAIRNWFLVFAALATFGGSIFVGSASIDAQQTAPSAKVTPTPPPSEEDEVVKVDTEAVNVLFTAQDRNRRLITSLKPDDVRILENGQPQQISAFSRQIDLPLSLAILIDTSASQERTLPEEKTAAISFLESVVRPAKDEVSVIRSRAIRRSSKE